MALLLCTFILASVVATAMIGRFRLSSAKPEGWQVGFDRNCLRDLLVVVSFFLTVCGVCAHYKIVPYNENSIVTLCWNHGTWTWSWPNMPSPDALIVDLQERLWLHCHHHHDPELGLPASRNPVVLR